MEETQEVAEQPIDQSPELETTTEDVQQETAVAETETQPEEQKTYTQQELEEKLAKRLARERRKLERELAQRIPQEPQELPPEEVINRRAQEMAERLVIERQRKSQAADLLKKGAELIAPDFHAVASSMPLTQEALDAALQVDNPHEVLYYLGQHHEEAEDIAEMPPHLQGLQIAKLSAKLAAKKPPQQTSNAPPPIKPVGAKGSAIKRFGDDLDDDEFNRLRYEYRKRRY